MYLKSTVRDGLAIRYLLNEIAPRYKSLPCGFTRVTHLGRRQHDSAEMGMIEFVNNPYEREEKNEIEITLEMNDMMTFWDWENRLLDQEKDYYEDHLRKLKAKMDYEINSAIISQTQADIEFLKSPITD